jgi:hypothetical protein
MVILAILFFKQFIITFAAFLVLGASFKVRNILLYLVISLMNAFTTAWLLAFGLDVFFGMWIPTVYIYVFFNNFGFSALFGMPLLIILTSDSVRIQCEKRRRHIILSGGGLGTCLPVGLI